MNPSKGQTWQARKSGLRFIILTAGPKQVTMRDLDGNKRTVKRSNLVKSYRPYVHDNGDRKAWLETARREQAALVAKRKALQDFAQPEGSKLLNEIPDGPPDGYFQIPPHSNRDRLRKQSRDTARAFAKSTQPKPKPQSLIPRHPKYGYKVPQPAKTERGKQAQEQAEIAVWQQWSSPSTFTAAVTGSSTYDNWTGGSFDVVAGDPTPQAKAEPKAAYSVWDKLLTPLNCILFVVVATALGIWLAS